MARPQRVALLLIGVIIVTTAAAWPILWRNRFFQEYAATVVRMVCLPGFFVAMALGPDRFSLSGVIAVSIAVWVAVAYLAVRSAKKAGAAPYASAGGNRGMIEDRTSWETVRTAGMARFVITRSLVVGLSVALVHAAPRWAQTHGIEWGSVLIWLAGGLLAGAVWALISWRMRERVFERDG